MESWMVKQNTRHRLFLNMCTRLYWCHQSQSKFCISQVSAGTQSATVMVEEDGVKERHNFVVSQWNSVLRCFHARMEFFELQICGWLIRIKSIWKIHPTTLDLFFKFSTPLNFIYNLTEHQNLKTHKKRIQFNSKVCLWNMMAVDGHTPTNVFGMF